MAPVPLPALLPGPPTHLLYLHGFRSSPLSFKAQRLQAWLAEHTGWPAVLINPAVNPARDLAAHVGVQTAYHCPEQSFVFEARYVKELQAMTPPQITRPERYLPIIATGDEVLSWQEMSQRYAGSALHLEQGSDHALSDFEQHLPALLRFLRL